MKNQNIEVREIRSMPFYWVHRDLYRQYSKELGAYGLAVYNALCYYANNNSQSTWVSMDRIADDLSISRRTVLRVIRRMEALKILRTEKRTGSTSVIHLVSEYWQSCDSQSQGGVTGSHRGCDSQSQGGVTHSHTNKIYNNKNSLNESARNASRTTSRHAWGW